MRDKNLSVECSVLESAPKQSEKLKLLYDAKTNQLRCLCQRFVRKFHNTLFYVVCIAYHCWVTWLSLSSGVSLLVY